ncbi:GumC family protein [Leptothoe spongobia]|uniref:Polysaccharide biosynthesis tyrosine autokinase n=1 Tax=Leptothoe spongobia TAU-MAC 1115 TaxID=1967444 RepID=A0A947DCJ0_9CYAN|nr:polysaccharide biosynthesis tyrosine autokinase [Leptothoe spongobia]MBT9314596.1 polysaccharide biosynthesis tyrosine autokinase [Leptothoe spongobia TAU-MAC 1115]
MDNLATSNGTSAEGHWKGLPFSQMPWDDDDLDLHQLFTVLRRRAVMIVSIAAGVMGAVVAHTLLQEPIYESTFQVLVEPVNADNQVKDFGDLLGDALPSKSSGLDYETQVQVLRSPGLIEQVLAELQTIDPDPDLDYEKFLEYLTIRRVGETKIIEVLYRGKDPEKIKETLDVLADVYLEYSLKERQTNLRQGIQFVNKQLPELEGKVDELQSQLEIFRQTHNFIDPTTQNEQIARRSEELSTQRLEVDRQLARAQTNYDLLASSEGSEAALQDAAVYQQLIQDLRQIEADIAAGLTRFQPDSLEILVLREKRELLLPVIEAEAQRVLSAHSAGAINDIQVLEDQSSTLNTAETQLQDTLIQLPTLAREYSDLQRELEIAVRALSRFLETRETLQIEAAQTEIPWELIEAPLEPTLPISPNVFRNLVLGLVASSLLGVGTALTLEKLDSVCRTVDELKAILKLPLLGIVPYQAEFDNAGTATGNGLGNWLKRYSQQRNHGLGPYGYGGSQFLESMRLLQTNLLLLGAERPIQSIILSSSMSGEGKSTVAQHLAQTAATMGKRVLLVDVDLRRPVIHKRLELENIKGLSDLLSGNATKASVLQRAMPFIEFYAMTAGSIPPDPVKLLSSKRMQQLMVDLEKEFDLIVYDAPPLVGLADTTLVAPHTDGVILVSRVNKCDRDILSHTIENIRFAKIPVLGLVANGVIPDGKGYKYYSYGYETPQQEQDKPLAHHEKNGSNGNGSTSPREEGLSLTDFFKSHK